MLRNPRIKLEGARVLILALLLIAPRVSIAQMFVRPMPVDGKEQPSEPFDAVAVDLPTDPDSLPPGGFVSNLSDEESDRLIREYRRQAGTVGVRKFFSDVKVTYHLSAGVTYDDNILLSSGARKKSDVVNTIAGGLTFSLGDFLLRSDSFLIVDYTATGNLFVIHDEEDALDQAASLIVRYRYSQLMGEFTSGFQSSHDATADLGERTLRNIYQQGLLLRYDYNDTTTFEGDFHYEISDYETAVDSSRLSAGAAVDYAWSDKIAVGVGAVFGYLEASGGLEEYYEQLQARFRYEVTDSIKVTFRTGVEFRERGAQAEDRVDSVFALTGAWTPYSGTTVTLEAHRGTQASAATTGDDYISTGLQLGVRQQLITRFYAQFDASYENSDYGNVTNNSTTRNDNYFTLRGAVGYDFVDWVRLQVFGQHRQDDSSQSINSFTNNQFGLQASFVY
jgi:hypothetical protein